MRRLLNPLAYRLVGWLFGPPVYVINTDRLKTAWEQTCSSTNPQTQAFVQAAEGAGEGSTTLERYLNNLIAHESSIKNGDKPCL